MDLVEKFIKGECSKTYQRVDINYRLNAFLGYNDDGQMSMVIIEYGREVSVKSSEFIKIQLRIREDKKLALIFDLMDESYKSIFLIFCKDIIETCENVQPSLVISSALMRWNYWKEMFSNKKLNILSKNEIKGLIAELIELRDSFMSYYEETDAIESWMGPLLGHKDFEIDNTWYEVKCINENAIQVTINSLEQLYDSQDGHLIIIGLEDANSVTNNSINLNQVVISVLDKIKNPQNIKSFLTKLELIGYTYDVEYESFNFLFKGKQKYIVSEKFPRISRNMVESAIGNVTYTIILNGIETFKEV